MRKGIVLTARDYDIFHYLSYGPSTVRSIFKKFFHVENGNTRTRERVMTRRLHKLKGEKFIMDQANPRIKDTIYVLSDMGATYVADRYGVEVSNVWTHFPKTNDIFHDLMVAGLARRIVREGESLKNFQLEFLLIESFLKKEHGGKKGMYYPDLKMGLTHADRWTVFDIEVDCGTISRKDFEGKIKSFEDGIMVVVKTEKRMNLLFRYLSAINTEKSVYITSSRAISTGGVFGCQWYTPHCPEGTTLMVD